MLNKTYFAVFTVVPFLPNLISIFVEKIDPAVLVTNPYISQCISWLDACNKDFAGQKLSPKIFLV